VVILEELALGRRQHAQRDPVSPVQRPGHQWEPQPTLLRQGNREVVLHLPVADLHRVRNRLPGGRRRPRLHAVEAVEEGVLSGRDMDTAPSRLYTASSKDFGLSSSAASASASASSLSGVSAGK
jgi:hypothetical protein